MSYETFELPITGEYCDNKRKRHRRHKKIKPLSLNVKNKNGTFVIKFDQLYFNKKFKYDFVTNVPFEIKFSPKKPRSFLQTTDKRPGKPSVFFIQIARTTVNGISAGAVSLVRTYLPKDEYMRSAYGIRIVHFGKSKIKRSANYNEFDSFWAFDTVRRAITPFYNDRTKIGDLSVIPKLRYNEDEGWFGRMWDAPTVSCFDLVYVINDKTPLTHPAWKLFYKGHLLKRELKQLKKIIDNYYYSPYIIEFQTFAVSYDPVDKTIEFLGGIDFNFHFAERRDHDYNKDPLKFNFKSLKEFTPEFLGCLKSWNRNTHRHHLKLDIKYPDPEKDDLSLLPPIPDNYINKNGRIFFYNE